MLSHFPSRAADEPVTAAVFASSITSLAHRIDTVEHRMRATLHDELRKQTVFLATTFCTLFLAGMGLAAGVGAAFGAG